MYQKATVSELQELARGSGLEMRDEDLSECRVIFEGMLDLLGQLDRLPLPVAQPPGTVRNAGREAAREEDPYNAIVRWCTVKMRAEGLLAGRRVGLKDSIAVAGIPMTCGSGILQGYVPRADSTVTERLLEQGAEIVATLNMDALAFSGGGDTSFYGPTLNPVDPGMTAGGSSGGSAAALYYDSVDITFGTDQGGSIRIPASWCGVLGLKPTIGLVPYTGIAGLDRTIDHVGPLGRSVRDIALALQAVAGGHMPETGPGDGSTHDYLQAVDRARDDLRGVRLGLLKEGLDRASGVEAETAGAVRGYVEQLGALGAEVTEVSVREHTLSGAVIYATLLDGLLGYYSMGGYGRGVLSRDLAEALAKGLRDHSDRLPAHIKAAFVIGTYLRESLSGRAYARAQEWRPVLRAAYDAALSRVDFLIMPAATKRAHANKPELLASDRAFRGGSMFGNAAPFNLTGHPALSMPAAEAGGLPVGVMLVGSMFAEGQMLSLAKTCEERRGWYPPCEGR